MGNIVRLDATASKASSTTALEVAAPAERSVNEAQSSETDSVRSNKRSRPLRILYHHRTRARDGQAVHIEELIGALRAEGAEIIIVEPPQIEKAMGSSSRALGTMRVALPKFVYEVLEFGYSLVAFWRLRKAYLEHKPDVLYERHNLFLLSGVWLKRLYRVPFIVEVNSPLYYERAKTDGLGLARFARWTEACVWREADAVLPVTEVLASFVQNADVPRERIHVTPNGIDSARFPAEVDTSAAKRRIGLHQRFVLGFTGFVRSWHGLDRVIDFLATPGREVHHLLIVGDGPARAELEAQARRLNVSDRVTFTGFVERDALAAFIAAFDVALQPAANAYASPLKLFEYMAMARPIVAPAQPNILEVLEDEVSGLLFDAKSDGALDRAIDRLHAEAPLRERLGQGALQRIASGGYTWRNNAKRVIALADRLIRAIHR